MKRKALILAALVAGPAAAQVVSPGALQQLRIDEEERRRQIERIEQQRAVDPKIDAPALRPAAKEDPNAVRFFVREIRFTRSDIFSNEELRAFAAPYEGKEQTLAALQRLAATINETYRKRGVVTAQALVPPQNVSTGVVEIRLVEGRLGSVLLKGNASTADSYIKDRIGLNPGDLVDLPALEDGILRFNRSNDVQLDAQLAPGSEFATTDLRLGVSEPPRHLLRTFVDNGGSRSTGEGRAGATYFNRSVLGFRDEFSLSTTQSGGQQSYSVSYAVPFNRLGGRATLAYYLDETEIRHGPFKSLDITGESRSTVLSLRQPVYISRLSQIDVIAGGKTRRNDNWISDVFIGRTETADGNLGVEAQHADASGYWAGSYNLTSGHATAGSLRESYWYGRGWLRRQQNIADQWSALGSFGFQNTGRKLLPSSEQFIIGGEGSVRGYPVGTYSGDIGYTLSAELHHPIGATTLGDGETQWQASGFFFVDHGYVRPYRPPNTTLRSYERIASAGWGMNSVIGKHVTAKFVVSYMFNNIPDETPSRFAAQLQIVANVF